MSNETLEFGRRPSALAFLLPAAWPRQRRGLHVPKVTAHWHGHRAAAP